MQPFVPFPVERDEPEDGFEDIKDYLTRNQHYHLTLGKSNPHSWPCSVWDKCPNGDDLEQMVLHGLVPRNKAILKPKRLEERNGETERSTEGDQ